jgi:hypothetical protein
MPRSMVGLLAAVVATMPVLASLAHGHLFWAALVVIATAGYLVGCATAPALPSPASPAPRAALSGKKNLSVETVGAQ